MTVLQRKDLRLVVVTALSAAAVPAVSALMGRHMLAQNTDTNSDKTADKNTASGVMPSRLTESRFKDPGWWPTRGDRSRNEYAGSAACAECHVSESKSFRKTAMAHAASRAHGSDSLQLAPLAFEIGPYRYQITDTGSKSILKISKGVTSQSVELGWAFGMGRMAQTYVYEQNGNYYESHLSFYTALQALDITPGHPRTLPPNLEEGAGRRISVEEKRRCFGCHTTESMTNNQFDPKDLVLGVNCESCHGPAAAHVAAAKAGDSELAIKSIVNPAHLNPVESADFCGACHRTWQDVVADGPVRRGALNIRFAPYRMENSRCWKEGKGDARMTCLTCHDPHEPLVEDPAAYDAKCLQCHRAASVAGATETPDTKIADEHSANHVGEHRTACPVGVKLCVARHMPRFNNPAFHFSFTDHWIRIAEPGAPLPD